MGIFTYKPAPRGVGQTTRVYIIQAADVGFMIGYRVTGSNMGGSSSADADPVGLVVPAAP